MQRAIKRRERVSRGTGVSPVSKRTWTPARRRCHEHIAMLPRNIRFGFWNVLVTFGYMPNRRYIKARIPGPCSSASTGQASTANGNLPSTRTPNSPIRARVKWDQKIQVPFAPETPASGVKDTGFFKAVWYRRTFQSPGFENGQRLIIHFGAVDCCASVWVNDQLAATHEGGYTPFQADITDLLNESSEQTIAIRAFDDPQDLAKPRGKQDWLLDAHSIWYPRTTGIWQTIWLEVVPATHVEYLRWTPHFDRWQIQLDAHLAGCFFRRIKDCARETLLARPNAGR